MPSMPFWPSSAEVLMDPLHWSFWTFHCWTSAGLPAFLGFPSAPPYRRYPGRRCRPENVIVRPHWYRSLGSSCIYVTNPARLLIDSRCCMYNSVLDEPTAFQQCSLPSDSSQSATVSNPGWGQKATLSLQRSASPESLRASPRS